MTTAAVNIPMGGFRDVYGVAVVYRTLLELADTANYALKSTNEKMIRAGGTCLTVKPSGIPAMESLYDELPNFAEVLDDVKKHIALCASSNDCLELPPMLLLGEREIGKTYFGRRLSQLLSRGLGLCAMSSMTAGWVISGASSQWKNAKPGKVFETILNGTYANPVIMVDELDKAGGDNQYDPLGALYTLLERDTAAGFGDEFGEGPIEAPGVAGIATANENSKIPDPILNRMNVYEIASPDRDGSARIAQAIYGEIRGSHDWGRDFPEKLTDAVQERLAELSPREMRRTLMNAL